jgi:hypothetical protein
MRRSALIRRLRREARVHGLSLVLVRQGSRHEIWRCGHVMIPIPRHREIDETTAEDGIYRRLEGLFGEGWWR